MWLRAVRAMCQTYLARSFPRLNNTMRAKRASRLVAVAQHHDAVKKSAQDG